MLLHSDLKLKRWDPQLAVYGRRSLSPIRDYDNTVGGGKMLSMRPVFMPPGQYYNYPSLYRALYSLPQAHGNENSVYADEEAIKDHIAIAVKHYILHEREAIKEEIIRDMQSGKSSNNDETFTRVSRARASHLDPSRVFVDLDNDLNMLNRKSEPKVEEIEIKSKKKKEARSKSKDETSNKVDKKSSKSKNSKKSKKDKKNTDLESDNVIGMLIITILKVTC